LLELISNKGAVLSPIPRKVADVDVLYPATPFVVARMAVEERAPTVMGLKVPWKLNALPAVTTRGSRGSPLIEKSLLLEKVMFVTVKPILAVQVMVCAAGDPISTVPKSGAVQFIGMFEGDPKPYKYPCVVPIYARPFPNTGRVNLVTELMENLLIMVNTPFEGTAL